MLGNLKLGNLPCLPSFPEIVLLDEAEFLPRTFLMMFYPTPSVLVNAKEIFSRQR